MKHKYTLKEGVWAYSRGERCSGALVLWSYGCSLSRGEYLLGKVWFTQNREGVWGSRGYTPFCPDRVGLGTVMVPRGVIFSMPRSIVSSGVTVGHFCTSILNIVGLNS